MTIPCDRCEGTARYWTCCGNLIRGAGGTSCDHEATEDSDAGDLVCDDCWDRAANAGEVSTADTLEGESR